MKTKGMMKKRVFAAVTCLVMGVSLIPMPFAKAGTKTDYKTLDKTGKYYEKIVMNPYTYYDVGGGGKQVLNDDLLVKVVKDNLIEDWANIANGCFRTGGESASMDYDRYATCFNNGNASEDCWGEIRLYLRDLDQAKKKGKSASDYLNKSGIHVESSLANVRKKMAEEISKGLYGAVDPDYVNGVLAQGPEKDLSKEKVALPEMADKTDKDTVVYSIATSVNKRNIFNQFRYNSFGIAFYDFQLHPITADDLAYKGAGDGYKSAEDAVAHNVPGVSLAKKSDPVQPEIYKNETDLPAVPTQKYMNKTTWTISNSTTNTTSETFGSKIGVTATFGAGNPQCMLGSILSTVAVASEFDYSKMYSITNGHSESESHDIQNESSITGNLPPRTGVRINHEVNYTTVGEDYDMPVALSFKVAIFSLTGGCYSGGMGLTFDNYGHGYYLNTIGAEKDEDASMGLSATENLNYRVLVNKSRNDESCGAIVAQWNSDGDYRGGIGTKWNSGFLATDKPTRAAVEKQATNMPMLSCGCHYTFERKDDQYIISKLEALNLPRKFTLKDGEGSYQLGVGEKLNATRNLPVDCLTINDSPYFGFHESDGHWVVCDESGNPTSYSNVIEIKKDGAGNSIVEGKSAGTAYITWKLNEGVKYTALDEDGAVTAATKLPTPKIEINVKATAFDGNVEIGGDFDGCVGDKDMNLSRMLEVHTYDKTGKEVKTPYVWEAKELPESGIKVTEDGNITLTKEGDFHVRAVVRNTGSGADDVYSEWFTIHANPSRVTDNVYWNFLNDVRN